MATFNIHTTTPSLAADVDTGSVNLGTEFYTSVPAWVTQVLFLQPATGGNADARQATIYSTTDGLTGTVVAGPFTMPTPTAGAWCTFTLPTPLQVTAATRYRVVIRHPSAGYCSTAAYFASDVVRGFLTAPSSANATGADQGSYGYSTSNIFPTQSFQQPTYYADVTITDVNPAAASAESLATFTAARTSAASRASSIQSAMPVTAALTTTATVGTQVTASTQLTVAALLATSVEAPVPTEHGYYSRRSGLTPPQFFSLADHKRAYLRTLVPNSATMSIADMESILSPNGRRAYWVTQYVGDPAGLSVSDLMQRIFAAV